MTFHQKIDLALDAAAHRRSAPRTPAARPGRNAVAGPTFSRLEGTAIAIGASERPAHSRPPSVERWCRILFGWEHPARLANDNLEALRRLASVVSGARQDLLGDAERDALRAGYDPAAVRAFVIGLRSGSASRSSRPRSYV
jgi:hypothetical protein